MFKIALHKDDIDALIRIQTNLNFGKVSLKMNVNLFLKKKNQLRRRLRNLFLFLIDIILIQLNI